MEENHDSISVESESTTESSLIVGEEMSILVYIFILIMKRSTRSKREATLVLHLFLNH